MVFNQACLYLLNNTQFHESTKSYLSQQTFVAYTSLFPIIFHIILYRYMVLYLIVTPAKPDTICSSTLNSVHNKNGNCLCMGFYGAFNTALP